ncbi:uncharacterized protein LOC123273338 [Cotesia glomerata]|uniref:uncharacterized protein LOC123273338 n=1 Tax=Cotesia glomerata TaxID=32391 RepID=UPI001D02736E|nr:uncharacterized protein LOC123273338 [Cotesia glomerata]
MNATNKNQFTVQGRDTPVPAADSLQTGCMSSSSSDRLDGGVDPKAPPSSTATGSTMTETTSLLDKRDQAIGREDRFLERLQELINETISTIKTKRTVSMEVTNRVKEAQRLLFETLVNRRCWKVTQRTLAEKEAEEKRTLTEELMRLQQASQTEKERTPASKDKKKRPAISPPDGPEKNVLRQPDGRFTVVTARGKRQRTGADGGPTTLEPTKQQKPNGQNQKMPEEEPFHLVDSKKKRKKKIKKQVEETVDQAATAKPAGPGPGTTEQGPAAGRTTAAKEDRRPRRKQRPEAVLIKLGKIQSCEGVLRALRSGLHPEKLGLEVKAVRTASKGGLLIEFEGSVKDRSALGSKITEIAGGDVEVRHLFPTATVVIDGMDAVTTVEEVQAALGEATEGTADGLKVTITKPNRWGAVRAFIEAELGAAATLETLGKVKVGWTVCRIRRWERLDRCYRCQGLGHLAGSCKAEEDRSGCCWRCGETDHQSKACTKPPRCHLCAEVGSGRASDHVAGSGRCKTYREVLQKKNG